MPLLSNFVRALTDGEMNDVRHRQRWTPADIHRRSVPGQACRRHTSAVVDEPQPLVTCSCRFASESALSCGLASHQLLSFHALSRAHVPWMCPASVARTYGEHRQAYCYPGARRGDRYREAPVTAAHARSRAAAWLHRRGHRVRSESA